MTRTETNLTQAVANSVAKSELNSDTTLLRLTLATLVAFLLAGAGILASANNQTPIVADHYRILQNPRYLSAHLPVNRATVDLTTVASRHHPEQAFASMAMAIKPASQVEPALSPEQLKFNALSVLRKYPSYFPTDSEYKDAVQHLSERMETQQLEINVRTFLLSQHMSNDSRLAELQMQPFFEEFNGLAFSEEQTSHQIQTSYNGVGFPHIESNSRAATNRYKPYKQLMSFSDDASGEVVPNVKCMGLSPERVAKRASQYNEQIDELSAKYNVSASLIKAVVAKESCFNPKAKSHVGAIGLMQLMPATARWLKVKQPENPQQNLAGGVRYLAQLRERFGGDELALAAYNAGPANVERYHGIPPFNETENYVVDVMHFYRGYAATSSYVNAQKQSFYP